MIWSLFLLLSIAPGISLALGIEQQRGARKNERLLFEMKGERSKESQILRPRDELTYMFHVTAKHTY